MSVDRRRAMVEPAHHRLSISAQCRLLRIGRSSYYYAPVPEPDETLALMTVIDETFMDCPWYGSRQMVICPLLSGPISILELAMKEEWNGKEAQAGRDHRQVA